MQMTGEQRVSATRQQVWDGLNDPEILRQCIPGCQSLERDGENRFVASAEVKIGPIGARFKGKVELSNLDAPNGYTITGSGSGGIAGSAKGGARVRLADAHEGGTLVSYTVDAEVGGRMAQLGGPIIDATARNLAGKFFAKFGEVVAAGPAAAKSPEFDALIEGGEAQIRAATTSSAVQPPASSAQVFGLILALVTALFAGFMLGRSYGDLALAVVAALLIVTAAVAFEAGRRGGRK